jgi:hypothetical protein
MILFGRPPITSICPQQTHSSQPALLACCSLPHLVKLHTARTVLDPVTFNAQRERETERDRERESSALYLTLVSSYGVNAEAECYVSGVCLLVDDGTRSCRILV